MSQELRPNFRIGMVRIGPEGLEKVAKIWEQIENAIYKCVERLTRTRFFVISITDWAEPF
jgi:hypothetical protein